MTKTISLTIGNLFTPKAGAKLELLFKKLPMRSFASHQTLTKAAQQSVTKIISLTIGNLVPPNAGPKLELLLKHWPLRSVCFTLNSD